MNEEQIQQIPLERIRPNPWNRHHGGFDRQKLQEMAETIKAAGVIQPAVVRYSPEGHSEDPYELVAGERRWRASKLAGKESLPSLVREVDDATLMTLQTIENLQREDIHPLDEAEGYGRLIEQGGYDVELLAQRVGRSPSYVYQRLKLRELVEPARKLLADGVIQAGHAILIARLPPGQQKEVLASRLFARGEQPSVRDVGAFIGEHVLLDLSRAAFKRDDAELVPTAGPCITCAKRTGHQPELFADVCNGGKRDYCTDPPCFQGKLRALVERRQAELKQAGTEHLEVLDRHSYMAGYEETRRLEKAGALGEYNWQECKKGEPGAKPALVVAGPNRGRLTWGKEREKDRWNRTKPSAAEQETNRKRMLEQRMRSAIRRRIWDGTLAGLEKKNLFRALDEELLRLVAGHLWDRTFDDHRKLYCAVMGWERPAKKEGEYGHPWEDMGSKRIAQMNAVELNRFLVTVSLVSELEGPGWRHQEMEGLKKVAGRYGLDTKPWEAKVRKEFAEKEKARAQRAPAKAAKPNPEKPRPAQKAKAKK